MSQNRDGSSDLNYLNETFSPIFYTFEIGKSRDWFLFESSGATACSLLKKYPTEWTRLKLTGPLGLKPRITLAGIARGFVQICLLGSLIRFYSGARERSRILSCPVITPSSIAGSQPAGLVCNPAKAAKVIFAAFNNVPWFWQTRPQNCANPARVITPPKSSRN